MSSRDELRAFLRSRRARLRPEDVGFAACGRRRVPGLRREELSLLAGVSVDYYTELEQGRDVRPSDSVLDAIARALRLDDAEREHLHRLARPRLEAKPDEAVRPALQALLDSLDAHPAIVLGRRLDVLAWNAPAAALIADFARIPAPERNIVRLLFLDAAVRARYADWDEVAADAVAHLRVAALDPGVQALAAELSAASEAFARLWARHDVKPKTHGVKVFDHPTMGRLELAFETLTIAGADQALVIYHAVQPPSTRTTVTLADASYTR